MTPTDPDLPCIIGVAQLTNRDGGVEPLDLWEQAALGAERDAGGPSVLGAIDDLGVVYCDAWRYDHPGERLAERLALGPGHREESLPAGTAHQRLLNAAAERLMAGQTRVALVVGGEALATRRALRQGGGEPEWSFPAADQRPMFDPEWFLPTEWDHGVLQAPGPFALMASAHRAINGLDCDDQRRRLAAISATGSKVAAQHPNAWFHRALTPAEIADARQDNRIVAWPFTKLMCAYPDVDMASATILTTHGQADALGVAADQRIYLRGWGFARDAAHVAARPEVGASPATAAAVGDALSRAGLGLHEVDAFDLYGCFPSAVEMGCDAIGLDPEDPRGWTTIGGLASFGAPFANAVGHSVATMVERLRSGSDEVGLVTGIGLHAVKHVAAVYSSRPKTIGAPVPTPPPVQLSVVGSASGLATIAAYTVLAERDGRQRLLLVCTLPTGERCYARSDDPDLCAEALRADWINRRATLRADGATNTLVEVTDAPAPHPTLALG